MYEHRLIHDVERALGWTGPSEFGAQFTWGRLPEPELVVRLLTPRRLLDVLMRRSLSPPQVRCLCNGIDLHPGDYIVETTNQRGQAIPMLDMHRLGPLLESGCTLVADAINRWDATMDVACRSWQWWARERVQVNTYLTTQATSGFALHWDDHDVIIVQLAGEKNWDIRVPSRPVPMYRDAAPNTEPSEERVWSGTLRAGDVMHIPRGYWHQATRTTLGAGYSLHVTFGIEQRTGVDWLTWLADRSRQDEVFRHDLIRNGAQGQQTQKLAAAACRLIASISPEEFLAERELQQPTSRQVRTCGVFGAPRAVVCVTDFPPRLSSSEDTIIVRGAGKRITVAAKAEPALRMLLCGQPVDLNSVSAATGIDAAKLADVLIEEGLCAEVTDELLSGYIGLISTENCWKLPSLST
ncbi:MAG: JmjC domain-containing protein [Pseudonocardiaceae bacterium]